MSFTVYSFLIEIYFIFKIILINKFEDQNQVKQIVSNIFLKIRLLCFSSNNSTWLEVILKKVGKFQWLVLGETGFSRVSLFFDEH